MPKTLEEDKRLGQTEADRRAAYIEARRAAPVAPLEITEIETPATGGRMMDSIAGARANPTPSNTKFGTNTLVSFPFEDQYFGDNPVDNSSRQTLSKIKGIKNALSAGRITLEEAAREIEPLEMQLDGTARRREARLAPGRNLEYATAAVEDAQFTDDRARTQLERAETKRDAIRDKLSQVKPDDNPTALNRQLADAEESVRLAMTDADEAGAAFATARSNRLESLAPAGGARAESMAGEVTTRGPEPSARALEQPGSDIRRELGDISATAAQARDDIQFDIESGIQPTEPTEEEKGRIRREITPKIKVAKTYVEKKDLLAEMRARLKGETTPLMDSKAEVAAWNRFDKYPQSAELIAVDAKANAKLVAKAERLQVAMSGATGQRAKTIRKQFDKAVAQIDKNLQSQSKVIEDENIAEAKKIADALDIATAREARLVKSGTDAQKAAAAKEVTRLKERKEDRENKLADEARKAKEAQALKKMEVESKRLTVQQKTARDARNARAKRDVDILEKDYDTANAKYLAAVAKREEFVRERDSATAENVTWGSKGEDKAQWTKKSESAKTASVTDAGRARHTSLADAAAAAKTEMRTARKIWTDADDKRIGEMGQDDVPAPVAAPPAGTGPVTDAEIESLHGQRWGGEKAVPGIWDRMNEGQQKAFTEVVEGLNAAPWPTKPKTKGQKPTMKTLEEYKAKYGNRKAVERMLKKDGWGE